MIPPRPKRPGIVRRVAGWFAAAGATVVILLALAVSIIRVALPHAPEYRVEAARWASEALGAPVEIGALDIRWRTLRPELVLAGVRFVSADATRAFAAPEVRVGLSVWELLRHARLAPARITVLRPDVIVDLERGDDDAVERWRRVFDRQDRRGAVVVEDGRIELLMDSGRRRIGLERVSGRIGSDGRSHSITASAQIPGGADGNVSIAMEAQGWPGEPGLEGTARMEARAIELVAIQDFGRGRLRSGTLDVDAELVVREGAARRFTVMFGLSQLHGLQDGAGRRIDVRRAAGELEWVRRDGGWDATLRNLAVGRESGTSESGPLEIGFTAPAGPDSFAHWRATAESLVIEDLSLLAEIVPWGVPDGYLPWLDRAPSGVIDAGELSGRHRAGAAPRWELRASASSLSLQPDPVSAVPGITGVGITVAADQDRGRAELTSDGGTVVFPGLFRERLPAGNSVIETQWTRDGDGWTVALPRVGLDNGDIALSGQGAIELSADGDASMRLAIAFRDASLAAKSPYLPVGIMQPGLVEWLDRAVLGGRSPSGTFVYDGALRAGALRDGAAHMEIEFDATDITLDFADDWPVFTDGDAHVRFTATGFEARVQRGSLGRAAVTGADVGIAAFVDAELVIAGTAGDRLADALAAFRATPVGRQRWLADLEGGGGATVALDIVIPLRRVDDTVVSGSIELHDAALGYAGMPEPVTGIRGRVMLVGDRVEASSIQARFLDRPLSIGVTTRADGGDASGVTVAFAGFIEVDRLVQVLGQETLPVVSGGFAWTAKLTAPFDESASPVLRLESPLVGLAVDLPAPLGKPADSTGRTVAGLTLTPGLRTLSVDAGSAGRLDMELSETGDGWRLARGRVHIGGGDAPGLPERDLALTGRVSAWSHVGGLDPVRHRVVAIDLVIGELTAFQRRLGEVHVRGARTDDAWDWHFDGDRIAGDVDAPDRPTNERPIRADLDRLDIPVRDPAIAGAEAESDARDVDPVAFHVGDFTLGIVNLGEIDGTVRRVENGVAMVGFVASRRDMRVTADASWHTVDGHHRTVLRGTLDSTDVRRTLAALGYRGSIDAAAGHLQVDLNWLGSPLRDPLALLDGTASVRLERGQLSDVQAGAGRVFGLLSVNALPRRLALDFSDVFERGLAFDTIKGDFRLERGDAYTDELVLQGPAARISISGRTGLAARDYDQEVEVIGSFGPSLALAGTLAGGPGVGAALLIASQILKRPLEDLARVQYRLTGPWDAPEFERVQEVRGEPR